MELFWLTYRLGFLVLFNCLVRSIRELNIRSQLRNNEMAGSTHHKRFISIAANIK